MTYSVNDFLNRPLIKGVDSPDSSPLQAGERIKVETSSSSILVFEFGNSLLGIKTKDISSILTNPSISQIPFISKRNSLGFISYSGCAVPVLDLAAILGLNSRSRADRIVVFSFEDLFTAFAPERILGVENLHLLENDSLGQNQLLSAKAYFEKRPLSVINTEQLAKIVSERPV